MNSHGISKSQTAETFKTEDVLESVLDVMELEIKEKGLALTCDISENLPERLMGDQRRIRQVLPNLVKNAVKYTESGEIRIPCRIEKIDDNITAEDTFLLCYSGG